MRAASRTLTTAWCEAEASALINKVVSDWFMLLSAAPMSCGVLPSIFAPLTEYMPCALTDTTQDCGVPGACCELAVGKLKFISLNLDHVVVSIKKMRMTSKTSMKGIKLMSGSAGALVLNFKVNLLKNQSRMAAKCLAKRSDAHSICSTMRSTLALKKRHAMRQGMATNKPNAVL
jgi:hypothetical protein